MNVQQEHIHAILMQHVQTMLVHIRVSAIMDLVVTGLFAPWSPLRLLKPKYLQQQKRHFRDNHQRFHLAMQ